jgi:hypothetical protein
MLCCLGGLETEHLVPAHILHAVLDELGSVDPVKPTMSQHQSVQSRLPLFQFPCPAQGRWELVASHLD